VNGTQDNSLVEENLVQWVSVVRKHDDVA